MLIIDEISYHKENLDYLFGIIAKKDEVNCVLLGYFAKTTSSFFQKNKKEICSYFYSNEQHLINFLHHLYSKSLVDPLKHFLVIYPEDHFQHHEDNEVRDKSKSSYFTKFYDKRVKAFQGLYSCLDKAEDFETISNAQYIIETLIAKIDQTVDGQRLLDDVVLRKENVRVLFICLKSNNKYKRKAAAEILSLTFSLLLNEVIEEPEKRNTMMAATTQANPEFSKFYEQKRKDEKNALFQTFVDELEGIVSGIHKRTGTNRSFNNTIGKEVKVVDTGDIRTLHLIQAALKFNLENLNIIISSGDFFDVYFNLFKNSGWNSSVHTLFADLIRTCLSLNKSPIILKKLAENNRLVKLLHDCTINGACFVDDKQIFRKAYCGAVNEVGTSLSKQTGENKTLFCSNDLWKSFFDEYLKPILDIERTDREDVFRKSSKFERQDYGNNLPIELFSALTNLQMARNNREQHTSDNVDNAEVNDNDEANNEGTEEGEDVRNASADFLSNLLHSAASSEVKHEEESTEEQSQPETLVLVPSNSDNSNPHNPEPKEQLPLPREFDMVLQHQKSIEEQVITTAQDKDLIQERAEEKAETAVKPEEVHDKPVQQPVKPHTDMLAEEDDDTKLDASIQ